uniref:Uncharacterized protein n=1 Tax=Molossus molossus TaxID=27622 RepID=A0A7J8I8N8_MOLMO|nr:hypothetical protein HJG59_010712 [Molossus molossus]
MKTYLALHAPVSPRPNLPLSSSASFTFRLIPPGRLSHVVPLLWGALFSLSPQLPPTPLPGSTSCSIFSPAVPGQVSPENLSPHIPFLPQDSSLVTIMHGKNMHACAGEIPSWCMWTRVDMYKHALRGKRKERRRKRKM